MRITRPALFLATFLVACGGDSTRLSIGDTAGSASGGIDCPANAPPAAPSITSPEPNRIDIIPNTVVFSSTPFSDADGGQGHGATDYEIWTVRKGALDERVWRAQVTDKASLTQAGLASGTFEGSAAKDGRLEEWGDYAVRARYHDDQGECSQASEWGPPVNFRTDDGSTYFFDPTKVREVRVTIPPESIQKINAEAYPPGCVPHKRNYYTGSLTFEGQVFDGVGIHAKGGCGSARDLNGKAGLKIKLDWNDPSIAGCPEERRLFGQNTVTLNNGVQDHSFVHERLGYELYRAMGVPTPRATHVRVFVNDEDWGMYLNVETISRRFLSRWFKSNGGMLYEGTYWCDIVPSNMPTGDDDSGCFTREFKPSECSTPNAGDDPMTYDLARQLAEKIEALPPGGFYPAIEAFFNFDLFLSQWAVESLISHWDAYGFSIINNYRVYHDPSTDKWTILPTGIDQTFGGDQDPWGVSAVLASRCTGEPTCNQAFAARLKQVNELFKGFELPAKAQAIYDLIAPGIKTDPRRESSFDDFNNSFQNTLDYIQGRPEQIENHLKNHGF